MDDEQHQDEQSMTADPVPSSAGGEVILPDMEPPSVLPWLTVRDDGRTRMVLFFEIITIPGILYV